MRCAARGVSAPSMGLWVCGAAKLSCGRYSSDLADDGKRLEGLQKAEFRALLRYDCGTKKKISGDATMPLCLQCFDFAGYFIGGAERDRTAHLVIAIHELIAPRAVAHQSGPQFGKVAS
jgi:hypothetical protein